MDLIVVQIRGFLYPAHLAFSISIFGLSVAQKCAANFSLGSTDRDLQTHSEWKCCSGPLTRQRERSYPTARNTPHFNRCCRALVRCKNCGDRMFLAVWATVPPTSVTGITVSIHSAMNANVGASVSKQRQAFHLLQGLFFPLSFLH